MDAEASRMRADALRNRNRIVEVARELFAERGLDVPMAAIARHAGVGVATLYRRFPTRSSLVTQVFAEQFTACVSDVGDALADPDPWRGFCTFLERVCAMQADDRGFTAAFLATFPDALDVDEERDRVVRGFAELTRRAKEAGRLRADFEPGDLTLLLMANGGIVADSGEAAGAASRRLVAYLLDALRAENADPARPLPAAAPLQLQDVIQAPASRT